ncbi:hypothetical protein J0895_20525 [Phormidium pseudopriestleyi FRX01]|uniref:Uncharacterized protein n=1 Tax=Phormidium pseudopriestleyi FRX01 TaxID=1759528 RepID=A0ABS3FWC7_9CYAN|nr:hypothetical protein [Phormidium pseudopriestleyi]MBO0351419.1 hypothetical protein [Phormidium pseudopriestleyi FRX01]
MGGEFTRKRDRLSYEERGWTNLYTGAIARHSDTPPTNSTRKCDRTSRGPHPNPPLAKVRGPEVKNLLL